MYRESKFDLVFPHVSRVSPSINLLSAHSWPYKRAALNTQIPSNAASGEVKELLGAEMMVCTVYVVPLPIRQKGREAIKTASAVVIIIFIMHSMGPRPHIALIRRPAEERKHSRMKKSEP